MSAIERVARAMAENAGFKWEHCSQPQWRSDARAGIQAMRDPPPDTNYRFEKISPAYKAVWRAMIEAALADGEITKETK